MANSKARGLRQAERVQRIWTLLAAGAAAAAVAVTPTMMPPAEATPVPEAAAPAAVQPIAAPAVLEKSGLIGPSQRKDRRARTTGMTIADGELYLWGWGMCGSEGKKDDDEDSCVAAYIDMFTGSVAADNQAPYTVEGLPHGGIVEMTAQKYNFNAIDNQGYVWGWGSISNVDGTGGSDNPGSDNDHIRNTTGSGSRKYGIGYGASYPPKRLRIGTAWDGSCREAGHTTIYPNCGPTAAMPNRGKYLGEDDPVVLISSTEFSGAAVTRSGKVYSWGDKNWGGVSEGSETQASHTDGSNRYGALEVQFPAGFDQTKDENKPVQILGGYQTYWILMASGEIWYFGGNTGAGENLGWDSEYERPVMDSAACAADKDNKIAACHDEPLTYSGRDSRPADGLGQIAMRSKVLEPYFRSVNRDEFIVQVHSGQGFGTALLSTGRVLTWGSEKSNLLYQAGAIGRRCTTGNTTAINRCIHSPHEVDFGGLANRPNIVKVSCQFTGVAALADDGTLYGWGGRNTSWEGYPDGWKGWYGLSSTIASNWDRNQSNPVSHESFAGRFVSSFVNGGAVVRVATGVRDFQDGQGYILWWDQNGTQWGRGWNRIGAVGHTGTNWGYDGLDNRSRDETRTRWVWFSEPQYEECMTKWTTGWENVNLTDEQAQNITFLENIGSDRRPEAPTTTYKGVVYQCTDLNKKDPATGKWLHRFTLEQCLAGLCKGPA